MSEVSTEVKSINDVVRDKVKESFVNLIPEDQWDAMVKKCVDGFVENDLPTLVKEILTDKLKVETADKIAQEIRADGYDKYNRPKTSVLVEMILKTMTPDLVNALIAGIAQDAMMKVTNSMRY